MLPHCLNFAAWWHLLVLSIYSYRTHIKWLLWVGRSENAFYSNYKSNVIQVKIALFTTNRITYLYILTLRKCWHFHFIKNLVFYSRYKYNFHKFCCTRDFIYFLYKRLVISDYMVQMANIPFFLLELHTSSDTFLSSNFEVSCMLTYFYWYSLKNIWKKKSWKSLQLQSCFRYY